MAMGLWAVAVADARGQDQLAQALATPSSLGVIPPASGGSCSTRVVTFDVSGVDVVQHLWVTMSVNYQRLGAHGAVLISPSGRGFALFTVLGPTSYMNPVAGTYEFGDLGSGSWLNAAPGDTSRVVPPDSYRTLNGTTVTSLDAAFAGDRGTGRWSLTLLNCYSPSAGQVTGAELSMFGTFGTVTTASSNALGAIPDGPSSAAQTPGPPRDVPFFVPSNSSGEVLQVSVRMTLTHQWVGDLVVQLIAPTGQSHVLFGYTGALTSSHLGASGVLDGTYRFADSAVTDWWPGAYGRPVPSGAYRASRIGGSASGGQTTFMNSVFAGRPSAGTWILRITDGNRASLGSITAAELTIETLGPPSGRSDSYSTSYLTPRTVVAPGVLDNDNNAGGGTMRAELESWPSNGTVSLQSTGAFTYVPRIGFAGVDRFEYRPTTRVGRGAAVTVTIVVLPPTTLQAPLDLVVSEVVGQNVTLRWKVPPGPAPADFILEGGVVPGQPVAAIGIGGPLPLLNFQAPRGIFFVRVRATAAGVTSAASNEIRLVVDMPEAPSAPGRLAGVVHGDTLGLSWRNTFAGGEPTDLQLLVSGSATAAVLLPLGESLSLGGIPPGTYTFRMRGRNRTGTGTESNAVTLTFPDVCSGPPEVPQNLLVFAVGNVVHAYWDPPASGTAATNYVLNVTGAFTGSVPMSTRSLRVPAPPGSYAIAVAAQNACGVSAFTSSQTAFAR